MARIRNGRNRVLSGICVIGMLGTIMPVSGFAAEDNMISKNADSEWKTIQSIISPYTAEWTEPTYEGLITDRVPHTALLGNGDVGVASGGDAYSKNFYISKSDFWGYNDRPKAIGGVLLKTAQDPAQEPVSLALGKKVTASSHHPDFSPERMVSGKWASGYEGWVSNVGNPQWAEIDLAEKAVFNRIVIKHDQAARGDAKNNTKSFTISTRINESDEWTEIYKNTENKEAITDLTLDTPVLARYVRLDVAQGTADGDANPRARIGQFEIFDTSLDTDGGDGEGSAPTSIFHEQQDILNARILTDMELDGVPVHMETRMMANDNLLVTALTSKGDAPVNLVAQAWAKSDNPSIPTTASVTNNRATVTRTLRGANSGDSSSYNTQAALTTQIIGAEVTAADAAASTADLAFALPAGETVYIVTAVGGGGRTYDYQNRLQGIAPADQAAALLDKAQADGALEQLAGEHAKWWKDYWSSSYIQLDSRDERLRAIQKYYYAAQYELGCTVREGKVAPGLYGIWHTTDNPSWKSDYHLNYNFISTFYGSAAANRTDQLLPTVEAITGYVENGRSDMAALQRFVGNNAAVREFFNAKIAEGSIDAEKGIEGGVLFPVGIGPWGMELDASYHNQTFNAPFSAYPLIQYYEYTQDEDFLRDVLYEYLKPILTFLEAWVVKNEEGVYDIYAGYNEGSWALNSVGELSTYRMCLRYAIMASEKLGMDASQREVWQDLLDNLAPYTVMDYNGKPVFAMAKDSYSGDKWQGQPLAPNRLTMEPVFPAGEFGYYSDPETLEILRNTMQVLDDQNTWPGINCFPELFTQALMIRYDTETVVDELSANIQRLMQANLTIDDTTHGIEKAGATEAVHQMLLTEDESVVKVFPGWLDNMDATFTHLRTAGAFLLTSSFSGEKQEVEFVTVTSEAGNPLTIASPWADAVVTDDSGKVIPATVGSAPNYEDEVTYTFATEKGKTYHLTKGPKAQQVDKSGLQAEIDKAESGALHDNVFVPSTLQAYQKAIAAAKTVLNSSGATQGNVDTAVRSIRQAFDKLEIMPVVIGRFSGMEQTYSVNNTASHKALLYADWKSIDGGKPLDVTQYDQSKLYLQMNVNLTKEGTALSDGALFNGGFVKLRSPDVTGKPGDPDDKPTDPNSEHNAGWGLGGQGFTCGDNRLSICLADEPGTTRGRIDWSQVERIILYIDSVGDKEGQFTMTLSDVSIVDTTLSGLKKDLLTLWNTDIEENAYTAESVEACQQALQQAQTVINRLEATQAEIQEATDTLRQALDDLVPAEPEIILGDVDGKDGVTAADALLALQAATEKIHLTNGQALAADVDGKDGVTASDALLILQYATKKITAFPAKR